MSSKKSEPKKLTDKEHFRQFRDKYLQYIDFYNAQRAQFCSELKDISSNYLVIADSCDEVEKIVQIIQDVQSSEQWLSLYEFCANTIDECAKTRGKKGPVEKLEEVIQWLTESNQALIEKVCQYVMNNQELIQSADPQAAQMIEAIHSQYRMNNERRAQLWHVLWTAPSVIEAQESSKESDSNLMTLEEAIDEILRDCSQDTTSS